MKIRPTTTVNALIWEQFLETIAQEKGICKGVIKESLEEALQSWIESRKSDPQEKVTKRNVVW